MFYKRSIDCVVKNAVAVAFRLNLCHIYCFINKQHALVRIRVSVGVRYFGKSTFFTFFRQFKHVQLLTTGVKCFGPLG